MQSTEKPPKRKEKLFSHNWYEDEYIVLLRVCADMSEEICTKMSVRWTLIACVLECARDRGIEIPEGAYKRLPDALAQAIREI